MCFHNFVVTIATDLIFCFHEMQSASLKLLLLHQRALKSTHQWLYNYLNVINLIAFNMTHNVPLQEHINPISRVSLISAEP